MYSNGSRYLNYYENQVLKCNLCYYSGHISTQCYLSVYKCIFCGDPDHSYKKCIERLCNHCHMPGHIERFCEQPEQCKVCFGFGHVLGNCLARIEACSDAEVSLMRCLYCKRQGHANCYQITGRQPAPFNTECNASEKNSDSDPIRMKQHKDYIKSLRNSHEFSSRPSTVHKQTHILTKRYKRLLKLSKSKKSSISAFKKIKLPIYKQP